MTQLTMDRVRARLLQIHTDWMDILQRWQPQTETEQAIKTAIDEVRQEYANAITPAVAIKDWWRLRAVENGLSFNDENSPSGRLAQMDYKELHVLPVEIQQNWRARLIKATPTKLGSFRLVNIRQTMPKSYEEGRVIVRVINEDEIPLAGVNIAFAYSTAPTQIVLSDDFLWAPPFAPGNAHIVPTRGGGEIEEVQGSPVQPGQPGGMTVYVFNPLYASDVLVGAGMLGDHTGLYLTFQLRRANVRPVRSWLDDIERRLSVLEGLAMARASGRSADSSDEAQPE